MKSTIGIFIHNPQCETECAMGMIQGFVNDFNIRTFGIDELNEDFLSTIDVLAFPGGIGDSDDFDDIFTEEHIVAVQDFVANGGKYLGICMGAYWADSYYFDIVDNVEMHQYIARNDSDIDTEYATVADVEWLGQHETMYFYDGCAIIGNDLEVIATYENGDAMAAIQGNVGMIGCHPEALEWWFDEADMVEYYNPIHANLMCDFVKQLVNK
jgi:glutamine amidotransferase-like uncharacterized protein